VYESDEFYELCDENGLMVWQDFAMGCTIYPQDDIFKKKIKTEADKVIRRLRHHPSLVLWAGNNENDVSLVWGQAQDHIDPNTDVISREVLPLSVREWDPERPYLPSSPFISKEAFEIDNRIVEELSPERHLWGPRGYYKAPFYTNHNAKFVSEIGYHGCPDITSLKRMMTPEHVYPWTNRQEIERELNKVDGKHDNINELFHWNKEWQCKATTSHPNAETHVTRNNLMVNQILEVFGELPRELEDFSIASQVVQGEAMKYFIEFWRMDKGNRNGILWWNLRDGWPIISDAIVDYYGTKKLAYHYIKKVQTDVCVMIGDALENGHPVTVVNDTPKKMIVKVDIKNVDTGEFLLIEEVDVAPNSKMVIGQLPESGHNELWMINYSAGEMKFNNHYLSYRPPLSFEQYKKWLPIILEK
jgi:beta-mannosidase